MKSFAFLLVFAMTIHGYAQVLDTEPMDLYCEQDSFDAGYVVSGKKISDKKYQLNVTAISGWGSDTVVFDGVTNLVSETVEGKCRYALVDDIKNPTTKISLRPEVTDMMEKLNGRSIIEILGALKCTVGPAILQDLPSCK